MALSGEGAICIWNDITDEGRDEFYAWHLAEHMPERVGIPGFLRGRPRGRFTGASSAASSRTPLTLPSGKTFYPLICYEIIFPGEMTPGLAGSAAGPGRLAA